LTRDSFLSASPPQKARHIFREKKSDKCNEISKKREKTGLDCTPVPISTSGFSAITYDEKWIVTEEPRSIEKRKKRRCSSKILKQKTKTEKGGVPCFVFFSFCVWEWSNVKRGGTSSNVTAFSTSTCLFSIPPPFSFLKKRFEKKENRRMHAHNTQKSKTKKKNVLDKGGTTR
jgi:hypothetical protein